MIEWRDSSHIWYCIIWNETDNDDYLQEQPNFKLLMDLLAGSIAGAKLLQTQVS